MKTKFSIPTVVVTILLLLLLALQQVTAQSIRGQVVDVDSKSPVIGANIILVGSDPILGTATDENGNFILTPVPVGRHVLKVTAIGYGDINSTPVQVISGKQLELNFELTENITALNEIVVRASADKTELNSDIATVSARAFNTEETARYAGSRNDPSRMAQNFAGVSNVNDARNDIVIRGNSPAGLLWRMEGIDIPSPNHYSSIGSTGGPVSMLNNNVLSKSDFMTSAFPSSYGNALSGVFDLQLRNGNTLKREYLGQVGFNGFEFGAEGPFKQGSQASYLVNYRYSTLGVFSALGFDFGTGTAVPEYQDYSYKINLPTKNAGRFTVFGFGGTSNIEFLGSETDWSAAKETDLYGNENEDSFVDNATHVVGASHTYFFNEKTSYRLTVAASAWDNSVLVDSIAWSSDDIPQLLGKTRYLNLIRDQNLLTAHLLFNKKFNAKNNVTAGVILNRYDLDLTEEQFAGAPGNKEWVTLKRGDGSSTLTQSYVNWQHRFSDKLLMNAGLHHQYYNLGDASAIEPRLGVKYQPAPGHSLSVGYGIHNQSQALPIYYSRRPDGSASANNKLDFTNSQHLAFGYDKSFGSDFRMKLETYYQWVDQVPVESTPSTFSLSNFGAQFGTPDEFDLVNNGKGRNYGVELTLEKFYSRQYYFLFTTSLFNSEYKASDNVWRSTAFDSDYVINLLGGKEWNVGSKKNTLALDIKLTSAGGRRYTPINLAASALAGEAVYEDETNPNAAFSRQYDAYFRTDIKISYRINRPKLTHEISLDVQNITNRENIFQETYNRRTNTITRENQLGLFPIPQYRILF